MLRLIVGLGIVVVDAAIPWLLRRTSGSLLSIAASAAFLVMALGVIVGVPLYPLSDLIVLTFSLTAGVLLGRVMPPRFVPFLVLLAVLSVLDLIQVALTSGPPPSSTTSTASPNTHLIWLNVRIGLPSGHFNIGFADLLLIAACSEHLRRRMSSFPLTLVPGLLGLTLAELAANTIGVQSSSALAPLTQALIPYLTVGWLAAELLRYGGIGRSAPVQDRSSQRE